jgi:hypothetical protein
MDGMRKQAADAEPQPCSFSGAGRVVIGRRRAVLATSDTLSDLCKRQGVSANASGYCGT